MEIVMNKTADSSTIYLETASAPTLGAQFAGSPMSTPHHTAACRSDRRGFEQRTAEAGSYK